jgi:hypothetical protein
MSRDDESSVSLPLGQDSSVVRFRITWLSDPNTPSLSPLASIPAPYPDWLPLVCAARFSLNPNKESLSRELFYLSQHLSSSAARKWASRFAPWPLAAMYAIADGPDHLERLAQGVAQGDYGDIADWTQAESRWKASGVQTTDFTCLMDPERPFPRSVAESGFPFPLSTAHGLILRSVQPSVIAHLVHLWSVAPATQVRAGVASFAYSVLFSLPGNSPVFNNAGLLEQLLLLSEFSWDFPLAINPAVVNSLATASGDAGVRLLVAAARFPNVRFATPPSDEIANLIIDIFQRSPEAMPLLRLIALCAAEGAVQAMPLSLPPIESCSTSAEHDALATLACHFPMSANIPCDSWVKMINRLEENHQGFTISFLHTLLSRGSVTHLFEPHLSALYSDLPTSRWRERSLLMRQMSHFLGLRHSDLLSPVTAAALGLPAFPTASSVQVPPKV